MCYSPWKPPDNPYVSYPCGACLECRRKRAKSWVARLVHELEYQSSAVFLTLTYDNDHLPRDNLGRSILVKEDLQLFWYRLRSLLTYDNPLHRIKYFACGEYGDRFGRPHYHAIVFGLSRIHEDIIAACWNNGFIKVGSVTLKSIKYTTSYITKKLFYDEDFRYKGRPPPFQTSSHGLGLRWAQAHKARIERDGYIMIDGRKQSIPRYYVRKLSISADFLRQRLAEYRQKQFIDNKARLMAPTLSCMRYKLVTLYDIESTSGAIRERDHRHLINVYLTNKLLH